MKTNFNYIKCVVIAVVSFFAIASVNAQTKKINPADSAAWVNYQKNVAAHLINELKGHSNCAKAPKKDIIISNGYLKQMSAEKHPKTTFSGSFGFANTTGKAQDTGTENRTSATVEVTLEYRAYNEHDGKNAKLAFYLAGSGQFSTPVTFENQKTYFYGLLLDAGTTVNPCGKAQLTVALTAAYLNSVSQEIVANDAIRGNIDFKSNPLYIGGMIKGSYVIGYIRRSKNYNIMGQNVTGITKTPIELFIKGRVLTAEVGKPKVNGNTFTWSGLRIVAEAGITIGL